MYFSNQLNLSVLWGAFLLGAMIGVLWLVVRICRVFFQSAFWIAMGDFLLCIAAVLCTVIYFQRRCDGQLRWFYLLAQGGGILLFRVTLGKILFSPICVLISFLRRAIRRLMATLFRPLLKLTGWGISLFKKITKNIYIFLKKPFIFLKTYIIINLCKLRKSIKIKERKCNNGGQAEAEKASSSRFYH